MKKLQLLLYIILLISFQTFAQNLSSVQRFIASNDYASAKKQIDSLLSIPSQKQETAIWFYRGKIYTEVGRSSDASQPELLKEALISYKRYQELDPQNTLMGLENNIGLFHLYDLAYNRGVEHYNREAYGPAYLYFKEALDTEEYIYKKNFSFNGKQFPALDTQLVSLTAFSAYLSGNEEAAIPYFEKLARLKMDGEEFKGVYTLLYQHFQKKDAAKAARYLNTGRKIFNDEAHWIRLEMGNSRTPKDRMNRYEEMLKKYPGNGVLTMNYAIDLFNYVYGGEKQDDHKVKQEKLQDVLKQLLRLDTSSALASYMAAQHAVNQLYDLEDQQRSIETGQAGYDAKMKVITDNITRVNTELIHHAEKAYQLYTSQTSLTEEDRNNCRRLINNLIQAYRLKKEGEKVIYYQDVLKGF